MDIASREHIIQLINRFYEQVTQDETIGFIFNDIAKVNWEKHLPLMYDFWETILLDTAAYKENVMGIHFSLNRKVPLEEKHFKRWLELFNSTVDSLYQGEIATLAKKRASSIASLMQFKMKQENEGIRIKK